MRIAAAFVVGVVTAAPTLADDWPQWRGQAADGVSGETGIPIHWAPGENIAWKAPLRGLGTSTPIVWDDQIFVTSQVGRGGIDERGARFANTRRPKLYDSADGAITLIVQAFRRDDGTLLWEHAMPAEGWVPPVHRKHNLASPSCVTDGELVYAWFGNGQIV